MALGDLYDLHFFVNCAGRETQCILGFEMNTGTVDADTSEAMCQAWKDDVMPTLLLALSDQAKVSRIQVTTVTDHQEVPGLLDLTDENGALIGKALPANMSALIHLATAAPSSKHNGRIYLAGCPEDTQEAGTFGGVELALIQDFADKLNDDLIPTAPQTAEFTPVVISRRVNGAPRVPPVGFILNDAVAKASIRQQRRRKTRHFGFN